MGARLTPSALLVSLALLVLAVGAGVVWARSSQGDVVAVHRSTPAVQPVAQRPASSDWGTVVHGLDLARAAAFADADPSALATVDAPGSPALAADHAAVRRLADAGWQVDDYRVTTTAVRAVSVVGDDAVLDVVDSRGAYEVLDASGRVVASQPARAERTWRVHLRWLGGAWLVHDVR